MPVARLLRQFGLLGAVVLALAVPVVVTFWLKDISHGIRPVREQHSTPIGAARNCGCSARRGSNRSQPRRC